MEARPIDAPEILIIEDEPLIAMYIEDALARSGYRTAGPFETVESAVQAAHRFEGAGALVDLLLDGADASIVTGILAERNIPFVIMTGRYAVRVSPRIERLLKSQPRCAAMLAEGEGSSGRNVD